MMPNDVDPTTLTLSEIYDQPDYYFDEKTRWTTYDSADDEPNFDIVLYNGSFLRDHNRSMVSILSGGLGNEENHVRTCTWCSPQFRKRLGSSKLGGYWHESRKPGEYVRPHP